MANAWLPRTGAGLVFQPLGSLVGKTVRLEVKDLIWNSTGYLAVLGGENREYGIFRQAGNLDLVDRGISNSIGDVVSLFGSSVITADSFIFELTVGGGPFSLTVDGVLLSSGMTSSATTSAYPGMRFRIGGRANSESTGTGMAYTMSDGDQVGDVKLYIDDVLTINAVMPSSGTAVPELVSGTPGVLVNPDGSDWVVLSTPPTPSASGGKLSLLKPILKPILGRTIL